MAIFAVVAPEGRTDLTEAVQRAFGDDCFQFSPGQFVVSNSALTAQGVTEKIGGAKGEFGQIAVFAVFNWWGFHNRALWEWLTIRNAAA